MVLDRKGTHDTLHTYTPVFLKKIAFSLTFWQSMYVPCTEALSTLQRPRVRVRAWGPMLRVPPPLSQPVPYHIIIQTVNKKKRKKKKIHKKKKKKKSQCVG